jgi:hypothetical protein
MRITLEKIRYTVFNLSGANPIKKFMAVIYVFSYYARVFVRQGWKSLPVINALAYYENSYFTDKKFS